MDSNGQGLKPILDYISTAWDTLTRSMTDCQSIVDPKIAATPVLYLPKDVAEPDCREDAHRQLQSPG